MILRPDQATTLRRAVSRTDHALTDPEPIRSLHRQFTDIGEYEKHVLDSTRLSPQATANTVLHGLAGGAYHLILDPESDSLARGHRRQRRREGHHPAAAAPAADRTATATAGSNDDPMIRIVILYPATALDAAKLASLVQ